MGERRRASVAKRRGLQNELLQKRLLEKKSVKMSDVNSSSNYGFGVRRLSSADLLSFRERGASFMVPPINETETIDTTHNIATNSTISRKSEFTRIVKKELNRKVTNHQDQYMISDDDDDEIDAWFAYRRRSQVLLSSPTLVAVTSNGSRRPSVFFDDSTKCITNIDIDSNIDLSGETTMNMQKLKQARVQLEVEQERMRMKGREKIKERLANRVNKSEDWLASSSDDECSNEEYWLSSDDQTNRNTNGDDEIKVVVHGTKNKTRKNIKKQRKKARKIIRKPKTGISFSSSNSNKNSSTIVTTTAITATGGKSIKGNISVNSGKKKLEAAKRGLMRQLSIPECSDTDMNTDSSTDSSTGNRSLLQSHRSKSRTSKTGKSSRASVKSLKKSKKIRIYNNSNNRTTKMMKNINNNHKNDSI